MDSSDLQSTDSTESTSSGVADNLSMITPSKRDIFLSTYRRQNFTLPDSIMHYIAKNPKNAKFYQKMIKRCKYFFVKNPILVLSNLHYNKNGWETYVNKTWKSIDINRIPTKLWITDELDVVQVNVTNNSVVSSIIPKIYQCDVNYLRLYHQIISYHEFMILCSSAQVLDLYQVAVSNDNDTVFSFKKLFEQLTQLKEIYYTFTTSSNNTAKVDFKELWNIPHCANYDHFCLYNIPEDFDIDGFYPFMKKNKKTRVNLCFSDEISEEYKARLEAFIDEIIDAKDHGYKPPYISFLGNNQEKFNKLHRLHLK